jgi:hypothetical protein
MTVKKTVTKKPAKKRTGPADLKTIKKALDPNTAPKENKMFPGRPNYTGPNEGYFAMLHHTVLFENTNAFGGGVAERVRYVKRDKPRNEIPIRLYNMLCLNDLPDIMLVRRLEKASTVAREHARKARERDQRNSPTPVFADMEVTYAIDAAFCEIKKLMEPKVLAYIRQHIPRHAWSVTKNKIIGT